MPHNEGPSTPADVKVEIVNRQTLACLLIILSGLVVYFPVLYNSFQTKWDDQWVVINNYTSRGFTIDNILAILTEYYHGQYAPANQLYYTFIYSLAGYDSFAFHAASLLVHLMNSCLVYRLLTKILMMFYPDKSFRDHIYTISFLSSVLFVIHPINAEAVAWIAASKILVYSFFYLLALNIYISHLESPREINYLYIFLLFTFSFAGKEQAVTFPVCMLLIHYFAGGNLLDRRFWMDKIPFFILSLFFGWVTIESQAAVGSGVFSASEQYPFFQRIVFASYALIEYAIKCVLPVNLFYIYPFPMMIGEPLPLRFYLYPITLIILTACGWSIYKKKPLFLFGALFFIIHISLALHLIPISRFAITADRYVYISSIIGCLCISFVFVFFKRRFDKIAYVVNVLFFFLLVSLGIYTNLRVRVWKDSETLKKEMKKIIESRPDFRKSTISYPDSLPTI